MTTIDAFRDSLSLAEPPPSDVALQALWWAGKAGWDRAHGLVQSREGERDCDLVHAYLHRVEGDLANAGYWYRRAGRAMPSESLEAEWAALAAELLSR